MTGFNKEHHGSTKYDYSYFPEICSYFPEICSYFPEICEKSISPPFLTSSLHMKKNS